MKLEIGTKVRINKDLSSGFIDVLPEGSTYVNPGMLQYAGKTAKVTESDEHGSFTSYTLDLENGAAWSWTQEMFEVVAEPGFRELLKRYTEKLPKRVAVVYYNADDTWSIICEEPGQKYVVDGLSAKLLLRFLKRLSKNGNDMNEVLGEFASYGD